MHVYVHKSADTERQVNTPKQKHISLNNMYNLWLQNPERCAEYTDSKGSESCQEENRRTGGEEEHKDN